MKDQSESPKRRRRAVTSPKIDQGSTAFRIVDHLGGPTECAVTINRSINTVYGWLQRGVIPGGAQQTNVHDKAAKAGKPFPAEWFIKRKRARKPKRTNAA